MVRATIPTGPGRCSRPASAVPGEIRGEGCDLGVAALAEPHLGELG